MNIVTRFAPSPTGYLHVGNVRTALICWLFARKNGGKFILRIDDTDSARSEKRYVEAIKEDLSWLGLDWDQEVFQSDRMDVYEKAKKRLLSDERLYPCYETAEELEIKKKMLLGRNKPPIYDRASLKLTDSQRKSLESDGVHPHYRFFLKEGDIHWDDLVRGNLTFDSKNLSDPVLIRGDGSMTYSIASVVDDIDFGITHIVRGEDHITNSATHIQLFEAFGAKSPTFAHISLLRGKGGSISKRYGGYEIRSLRQQGIDPMAILSFLAKIGTSDPIENSHSIEHLLSDFSINKQSKSSAIYDEEELNRLNTQIIHNKSFDSVYPKLKEMGMGNVDQLLWDTIKSNIKNIHEVKEWYDICCKPLASVLNDKDLQFTKVAAELLPNGEFSLTTWNEWIKDIKKKTNREGKDLFMPIRMALTGKAYGPELKFVLMILGRDKAYKRLNGIEA